MPFSLGPMEMVFIMLILLLVFGAKRLPELGSGLGRGIKEFKRSMRDLNVEIARDDDPAEQIGPPRRTATMPPVEPVAGSQPVRSEAEASKPNPG